MSHRLRKWLISFHSLNLQQHSNPKASFPTIRLKAMAHTIISGQLTALVSKHLVPFLQLKSSTKKAVFFLYLKLKNLPIYAYLLNTIAPHHYFPQLTKSLLWPHFPEQLRKLFSCLPACQT